MFFFSRLDCATCVSTTNVLSQHLSFFVFPGGRSENGQQTRDSVPHRIVLVVVVFRGCILRPEVLEEAALARGAGLFGKIAS